MSSPFIRDLRASIGLELLLQWRQPAALLLLLVFSVAAGPLTLFAGESMMQDIKDDDAAPKTARGSAPLVISGDDRIVALIDDFEGLRVVPPGDPDAVADLRLEQDVVHVERPATADGGRALQRIRRAVGRSNRRALSAVLTEPDDLALIERDVVSVERAALHASGDAAARALPGVTMFLMLLSGLSVGASVYTRRADTGADRALYLTAVDRRALNLAKLLLIVGGTVLTGLLALLSASAAAWWHPFPSLGLEDVGALGGMALLPASGAVVAWGVQLGALTAWITATSPSVKQLTVATVPIGVGILAPIALVASPDASAGVLTAWIPLAGTGLGLRAWLGGELTPTVGLVVGVATVAHLAAAGWLLRRVVLDPGVPGERLGAEERRAAGDFAPDAMVVFLAGIATLFLLSGSGVFIGPALGNTVALLGVGVVGVAGAAFFGAPLRDTLQLRLPSATDAALAVVVGVSVHVVGALVSAATSPFLPTPAGAEQMIAFIAGQPLALALLFGAVAPGINEEILCRGTLLGMLRTRHSIVISVAVSSALFGVLHLELARIPATAAMGAVFALLAVRSRSIVPGMIAHTVNNGLLFAAFHHQLPIETWLTHPLWLTLGAATVASAVVATGKR